MTSKASQFRHLLTSNKLEFIMEAHNGISAKIVEETGFQGIWASGLALSAQFGVRDNNEASWTQILEMLEFMSDVTTIPILLDGDTGYGNFNNMRRLVKKLGQREIAGVCIEDKLFPKTNSFIAGERQPLADIDEFCGKIKAGKDSQTNSDFSIIARVEALIAGWDLDEALKRAEAYYQAGADGILIHSKLSRPDQILAFAQAWNKRCPLVIVPTKYYSTPTEVFRQAGVDLVIWANHLIRASVEKMQRVAQNIYETETLINIEDQIVPVKEIFRLQGADELLEAERRYFTPANKTMAVILSASQGKQLQELTVDKPKVMIPIGNKPLLRYLVDNFKMQGINDITVVGGYQADKIKVEGVTVRVNVEYETTGELDSLLCADWSNFQDVIVSYGDLLFRNYILRDLLDHGGDVVVVVDSAMENLSESGSPDYAICDQIDSRSIFNSLVYLLELTKEKSTSIQGRWLGLVKFSQRGVILLNEALQVLRKQDNFHQLGLPDLCNFLLRQGVKIQVLYIHGHWLDVNGMADFDRLGDFL